MMKSRKDLTEVHIRWSGEKCNADDSRQGQPDPHQCPSVPRVFFREVNNIYNTTNEDYNTSCPKRFLNFLIHQKDTFQDVNFIASHGKFIRLFVKLLSTCPYKQLLNELNKIEDKNLFIVGFNIDSKKFYLVRHCRRIYQKQGLKGFVNWARGIQGERNTPDPDCWKSSGCEICHEDIFKKMSMSTFNI